MVTKTEKTARRTKSLPTPEALRLHAIDMMQELGYHAVTLRSLADRIGIKAASLYNHIENKEQLLFDLLSTIQIELLEEMEKRLDGVEGPRNRLRTFVDVHIEFHTTRRKEVFIGNMERRNLSKAHNQEIIRLRTRYQAILEDILRQGRELGEFDIIDMRLVTNAIFGALNDIATWHRQNGRLGRSEISHTYTQLIFRMLGILDEQ
ncbi:MAG: TetR/AcrR family transcriptional regulator [Pseudaminobacter sp.]